MSKVSKRIYCWTRWCIDFSWKKDKYTDDTIDYAERWYTSFVQNSSSWCILIKRVYVLKNLQNNCNKSQSLHKYNVSGHCAGGKWLTIKVEFTVWMALIDRGQIFSIVCRFVVAKKCGIEKYEIPSLQLYDERRL